MDGGVSILLRTGGYIILSIYHQQSVTVVVDVQEVTSQVMQVLCLQRCDAV